MKKIKSTFGSFTAFELLTNHKLKIVGGLPQDGIPPQELPDEPIDDEGEDPQNGSGPLGSGPSTVATGSAKTTP